jgi:hypothetical protein
MSSIENNFVPYQIALDMKLIGFDEPCFAFYDRFENNKLIFTIEGRNEIGTIVTNKNFVISPLYQQAFRWFRKKYNISYSIDWISRSSEFYNGYYVHFRGINGNKINQENFIVLNDELPPIGYQVYKSYEEAEFECLKKLIEIVKNKK